MIFIEASQLETKIEYQSQEIEHLKTAAKIHSEEIDQQKETRFEEIRQQVEKCKVNSIFI